MQTKAGSHTADIQNRNYRLVVLDLVTLAERIQASMKLLEQAISGELPRGNPNVHDDVFVLDDVTPCYVKASAALHACHVGLSQALHLMQSTPASGHRADWLARSRDRPAGCA
jgi:hypothetical protein